MLTINDEQVAKQLRAIAEREQRPVDEVIKSLLEHYPLPPEPMQQEAITARVRQMRLEAYENARQHWREHGDTQKANLTDAELDEQFWLVDADGIPRLKSERGTIELPPGSGALLAESVVNANIPSGGKPIDVAHADDILNAEYADYLLHRMRGEDETE